MFSKYNSIPYSNLHVTVAFYEIAHVGWVTRNRWHKSQVLLVA